MQCKGSGAASRQVRRRREPCPHRGHALIRRAVIAFLVLAAWVVPAGAVDFGKRVALVVGNGAYDDLGTLPNPPRDARDIAAALEALQFEVHSVIDGDIDTLQSALRRFGRAAVNADTALFYYAGHGMALNGENYLLPIGARIEVEPDLAYEALSLSEVQRQLEFTDAKLSMIILDACRDNPLGRALQRNAAELGRSVKPGEGLAPIEVAPASGMLIAYATAPGSLALDGSAQPNSPFTAALLDHIATPSIDVRVMFGRVRSSVVEATQSFQTPWVEDGMLGEFQFNPVAPEPETPPPPAPPPEPADWSAWREIAASDVPADFEAFLADHPESLLAGAARDRLALLNDPEAEFDAWTALQGSDDVAAYESFLRRFPSGPYSAAVSIKLQGLLWAELHGSGDVGEMETFLARFPAGPFAGVVRERIGELKSSAEASRSDLQPNAGADGAAPGDVQTAAATGRQRALTLVQEPPGTDDAAAPARAAALARAGEIEPHLIQIALRALGHYDGRIDGLFGPASRRAAAEFQARRGAEPTGELLPEDIVQLVAEAAETGDPDCQNIYGGMLAQGIGVVQDHGAAVLWFRRSADGGSALALANLGILYRDGLGVERDVDEARRLFEAAANGGEAQAQQLLETLE